ncbi:heme/hemin ABC transporter substrate-binding protein [Allorhizobium undicola]|uniref:heme/hemin ABC transporter substrate-binding protein n=1 Tax=Allorhizobium undicola TaxID=78527 RepID=UPI000A648301|nr:ABC transporter substrate-binding protein [Allorhizobium undicola]
MTKKIIASRLAFALFASLPLLAPFSAYGENYPQARRIVSVGGTVTEILYDLGAGDRVIAVDTTSLYPPEAKSKPNVGYMRQLSAEGILAQKPDLIMTEAGSGPPDALALLKSSGIPLVSIDAPPGAQTVAERIRAVGEAVGKSAEADKLARDVDARLQALQATLAKSTAEKKKVLFVLSMANGRVMAAGRNTAADAMIRLSGGVNAAGASEGYKPMSDEALIAAAPDVVLTMQHGAQPISAADAFALPALAASPAAKNNAFISMDGLFLLGFGPRTPEAARELAEKLYPQAAIR